jgi:hypothetical protein
VMLHEHRGEPGVAVMLLLIARHTVIAYHAKSHAFLVVMPPLVKPLLRCPRTLFLFCFRRRDGDLPPALRADSLLWPLPCGEQQMAQCNTNLLLRPLWPTFFS